MAPRSTRIRPTASLVRQALFDHLGELVVDSRCLDLFAGSGAIAFEALSRGALLAWAMERDPVALRALRSNAQLLDCSNRLKTLPWEVARGLRRGALPPESLDWAFLDPPYGLLCASGEFEALLAELALLLRPGAICAVERGFKDHRPVEVPGLRLRKLRRYGDSCLIFYAKETLDPRFDGVAVQ